MGPYHHLRRTGLRQRNDYQILRRRPQMDKDARVRAGPRQRQRLHSLHQHGHDPQTPAPVPSQDRQRGSLSQRSNYAGPRRRRTTRPHLQTEGPHENRCLKPPPDPDSSLLEGTGGPLTDTYKNPAGSTINTVPGRRRHPKIGAGQNKGPKLRRLGQQPCLQCPPGPLPPHAAAGPTIPHHQAHPPQPTP